MAREFGLMATPVLSPFSTNRHLFRQKRKIPFTHFSLLVTTAGGTSLVAHPDWATLLVTECQNTNCFARDTSTVASNGVPTSGSIDLQLGTAGQAIIVYTTSDDDIGIGLCHQSGCGTSAVATTIDTNDIDGASPRFTIDSIGQPIVTSTTLIGDLRLNIP